MTSRSGRTGARALVLACVLTALCDGSASARPAAANQTPPSVVVIAVPDLRWSDVSPSQTPAIWRLVGQGAAGLASVKSRWDLAGCADGLLTLGAGDRVAAERQSAPARPCAGTTPDQLAPGLTDPAGGSGALAAALRAHGVRTAALGDGATLALPGADTVGPLGARPTTSGGAQLALAVDDALYAAPDRGRGQAVRAVDARIAALVDPLPATSTVLLVGSSDQPAAASATSGTGRTGGSAAKVQAHLHVALARGPGFPPGSLTSSSTKRAPYVELIDVAPTVLRLLGVPVPSTMVGRPWAAANGPTAPAARAAALRDLSVKAVEGAHWRPAFMWTLGLLAVAVAALALALCVARARRSSVRGVAATTYACLVVACLPVASWLVQLVPWWRWPILVLPALLVAVAATVAAVAALAGRRRPARSLVVVVGVSTLVLVADLVSGARLQTSALLGDSPITAGRFYGAGNTAFGVLAVSALLGTAVALAPPPRSPRRTTRLRAMIAAAVLLVVGLVDAAPSLGADLGGALAFLPSALLLALLLSEIRLSWRRASLAVVAGLVPVLALAAWDYHRPADRRTHIGVFVSQVVHGQAGSVVGRKLSANLGQLVSSPFLPLLAGTAVVVVLALRWQGPRLRRTLAETPGLAVGLLVVVVCAVLGGVLNDSGATVTGIMLSVALPAVSALALRAHTDDTA